MQALCRAHGMQWVLASDGPRGVLLCSATAAWQAYYDGPPLDAGLYG